MAERSSKGCLVAAIIWIIILGALSVAAKFYILPYFDDELADLTGNDSRYKHTVTIAADSFSGYSVLRSAKIRELLSDKGIRLIIVDDNAGYNARMGALERRNVQMAVFTVDSFISSGLKLGKFPAAIVSLVDESQGADAIISYRNVLGSIHDLNTAKGKIELTPDSPSEFLARTMIARFNLPQLSGNWMVKRDGAKKVFESFLGANKNLPVAYALWEPYVSLALKDPDAHILIDSSKLSGHIIDVLVAERHFLRDNPEVVVEVLRAYFNAFNYYIDSEGGMEELLLSDSGHGADKLSKDQAKTLAKSIDWKNTLQNYAAFDINRQKGSSDILLEDGIANVVDVLKNTGAIAGDALSEQELAKIFYSAPLQELSRSGFRPDSVKSKSRKIDLRELSADEWQKLVPVGEMKVKPVSFARGRASINFQSRRELEKTARTLLSLPGYYLKIYGNTRSDGDSEANRKLALERAQAVYDQMLKNNVPPQRLKREMGSVGLIGGEGQSVTFELVQRTF